MIVGGACLTLTHYWEMRLASHGNEMGISHTRTDGDACRTHLVPSSHGRSHHTSLSWSRSPFIFLRGPAGVGICAAKRNSTGTSSKDTAPSVRGRPAGKITCVGLFGRKRSKELRQERRLEGDKNFFIFQF